MLKQRSQEADLSRTSTRAAAGSGPRSGARRRCTSGAERSRPDAGQAGEGFDQPRDRSIGSLSPGRQLKTRIRRTPVTAALLLGEPARGREGVVHRGGR